MHSYKQGGQCLGNHFQGEEGLEASHEDQEETQD